MFKAGSKELAHAIAQQQNLLYGWAPGGWYVGTRDQLNKIGVDRIMSPNPFSPGATRALVVGGLAVVAAGGVTAAYLLTSSSVSGWRRLNPGETVPAGGTFAIAIVGPPELIALVDGSLKNLQTIGSVTGVSTSAVGMGPPIKDWPTDDTLGAAAYRATGTTKVAGWGNPPATQGVTYFAWVKQS